MAHGLSNPIRMLVCPSLQIGLGAFHAVTEGIARQAGREPADTHPAPFERHCIRDRLAQAEKLPAIAAFTPLEAFGKHGRTVRPAVASPETDRRTLDP